MKSAYVVALLGAESTGKTTLARILSKSWKLNYKHLSAISVGVKEVKELKGKETFSSIDAVSCVIFKY